MVDIKSRLSQARAKSEPASSEATQEFIDGAAVKSASQTSDAEAKPPWEGLDTKGQKKITFPIRVDARDNAMFEYVSEQYGLPKAQVIKQLFINTHLRELAEKLWRERS